MHQKKILPQFKEWDFFEKARRNACFAPKTPKRRERELAQIFAWKSLQILLYLDAKMGKHLKANIRCSTIYTTWKL